MLEVSGELAHWRVRALFPGARDAALLLATEQSVLGGRQNRPDGDCGPCRHRQSWRHRRRLVDTSRRRPRCSLVAVFVLAAQVLVLPCGRAWPRTSSWPRLGSCVPVDGGARQWSEGGTSFLQLTAHKHGRPSCVLCVPRCRALCALMSCPACSRPVCSSSCPVCPDVRLAPERRPSCPRRSQAS